MSVQPNCFGRYQDLARCHHCKHCFACRVKKKFADKGSDYGITLVPASNSVKPTKEAKT